MTAELRIYYQNVRGIRTKLYDVYKNVSLESYDIVCFTETWLHPNIFDGECFPDCYTVFRSDRNYLTKEVRYGGGVLIAVKKCLQSHRRSDLEVYDESVWVEIELKKQPNLLIGNIYFPPRSCLASFVDTLDWLGSNLDVDRFRVVLLGDFNVPNVDWNFSRPHCSDYCGYADAVFSFLSITGLKQINTIKNPAGNILDLVICDESVIDLAHVSFPIVNVDSWHPPFSVQVPITTYFCDRGSTVRHLYAAGDYDSLYKFFRHVNWKKEALARGDVDSVVTQLTKVVQAGIDIFIPKTTGKKSRYPCWFSVELKHTLRKKLKYHRKFKNSGDELWYQKFSQCRSLANLLYDRDKMHYYSHVEASMTQCPKSFWRVVKAHRSSSTQGIAVKDNGLLVADASEVSEVFAAYFYSVYTDKTLSAPDTIVRSPNCLPLPRITEDEVAYAIKGLEPKKTVGVDRIPAFIVKGCSDIFVPILTDVFNMSMLQNTFPALWKQSVIIPVHKGGRRDDVRNYRPISLLCTFSKVFEKVIHRYLSRHFSVFLSDTQHGFVNGRSVETNLTTFLDYTAGLVGHRGQVDAIYFDCSKAFDLVNHNRLVAKLSLYGLSDGFCDWFRSYLSGRPSYVKANGACSSTFVPVSGVPQGSTLGPLLFNVFVNDAVHSINYCKLLQFADDAKIFCAVTSPIDCFHIQNDIDTFAAWCDANGLVLNSHKTKALTFTKKKAPIIHDYCVSAVCITRVHVVRDLGVTLDCILTFSDHVTNIVKKAYTLLGLIIRIGRCFRTPRCLLVLYQSLVLPALEFASVIWNSIAHTKACKIEGVQRKFERVLRHSFPGLRMVLHSLSSRRIYRDLLFLYKCLANTVDCVDIVSRLNFLVPTRPTRLRNTFYVSGNPTEISPSRRLQILYNLYGERLDLFSGDFCTVKAALRHLLFTCS